MTSNTVSARSAWIGLGILTVLWSLSWSVMKVAMSDAGPFAFGYQRYVLGTLVLFVLVAIRRQSFKPPPLLPTIAIGLSQTTVWQGLAAWALVSGGAGKTALLGFTMPFWAVPLAWWWLHEKPGLRRWACIALAAVGYLCVIEPWKPLGAPQSIVMAVIAGLGWAVGTVLTKRLFQQHPEVRPLQLTAWQMLFGTLGLAILAFAVPERSVIWSTHYIAALAYCGLLSSGFGWLLWSRVVHGLAVNVAGLTSLAIPVVAVLFAWGLLAERPSIPEGIGIVLIGAALIALQFGSDAPA